MAYCNWGDTSEANRAYHDSEWGIPLHDDRKQFEFLSLEVMQCGLSWELMIRKREIFRKCFLDFDFDAVAGFGPEDVGRIMAEPGMIRSERKIRAVIGNARCVQDLRREAGTFSAWLWAFSGNRTILYDRHGDGYIPAANGLSVRIGKELKKRGFQYMGPVTVYSHLQACGIVNDHGSDCPRYRVIVENFPTVRKRRDHELEVRHFG